MCSSSIVWSHCQILFLCVLGPRLVVGWSPDQAACYKAFDRYTTHTDTHTHPHTHTHIYKYRCCKPASREEGQMTSHKTRVLWHHSDPENENKSVCGLCRIKLARNSSTWVMLDHIEPRQVDTKLWEKEARANTTLGTLGKTTEVFTVNKGVTGKGP